MKRRDFLRSTPTSAIGLGAVAQMLTTDAFGREARAVTDPVVAPEMIMPPSETRCP
jgi:hypothetical protein